MNAKSGFGEAFNIGNGRNISVNDVTNAILKLNRKNIKPIHGPAVIEPKNTLADIEKVRNLLKWSPKHTFEEGLEKTYEHFVR